MLPQNMSPQEIRGIVSTLAEVANSFGRFDGSHQYLVITKNAAGQLISASTTADRSLRTEMSEIHTLVTELLKRYEDDMAIFKSITNSYQRINRLFCNLSYRKDQSYFKQFLFWISGGNTLINNIKKFETEVIRTEHMMDPIARVKNYYRKVEDLMNMIPMLPDIIEEKDARMLLGKLCDIKGEEHKGYIIESDIEEFITLLSKDVFESIFSKKKKQFDLKKCKKELTEVNKKFECSKVDFTFKFNDNPKDDIKLPRGFVEQFNAIKHEKEFYQKAEAFCENASDSILCTLSPAMDSLGGEAKKIKVELQASKPKTNKINEDEFNFSNFIKCENVDILKKAFYKIVHDVSFNGIFLEVIEKEDDFDFYNILLSLSKLLSIKKSYIKEYERYFECREKELVESVLKNNEWNFKEKIEFISNYSESVLDLNGSYNSLFSTWLIDELSKDTCNEDFDTCKKIPGLTTLEWPADNKENPEIIINKINAICPNITTINFTSKTDENKALISLIKSCKSIKNLNIENSCQINIYSLLVDEGFAEYNKYLENLKIEWGYSLAKEHSSELFDKIGEYKNLKTLHLSYGSYTDVDENGLSYLLNCKDLSEVSLINIYPKKNTVIQQLKKLENLTDLDLSLSMLRVEDFRALEEMKNLTHLRLDKLNLTFVSKESRIEIEGICQRLKERMGDQFIFTN